MREVSRWHQRHDYAAANQSRAETHAPMVILPAGTDEVLEIVADTTTVCHHLTDGFVRCSEEDRFTFFTAENGT